jgi:putative membrane protein
MMDFWMMSGLGWWVVIAIVFILLLVIGGFMIFSGLFTQRGSDKNRALQIAEERYAKGEITVEEFEEIKRMLLK